VTEGPATPLEDAQHWDELQRLFHLIDGIPAAERENALAAACKDAPLRARVLALVHAADAAQDAAPQAKLSQSTLIGPYRLVRQIGAGGVGTVYLVERLADGARLTAALKILAPYAVDASFVERFHREQQHLAVLDHPNITRLLDAGWTESGQPYLVTEYVDGVHLDAYCDARRLNIAERLHYFLQICAAVNDAHRHLIVHLDLKPSNVIVSDNGTVKLLDFGTSKLLQLDGSQTATVMATPAYASPEQLLGNPVSTASDVYGLGAILYELLAGRAPFGKASTAGRIESAYREADPPELASAITDEAADHRGLSHSALRQMLRGDLAAIVATCLRALPRDRYSSVEALAAEIQRYLDCEPVLTRRQTLSYRAGKFLRRHRLAATVAAAVTLTVTLLLGYAWMQQQHALREADRAVRMQTFLFRLFKMANPNYTGTPIATVPELLRVGISKLPDFIHDPADLRQAQLGLAESMFESGTLADARSAFGRIIESATVSGASADKAEAETYAGVIDLQQGHVDAGRALLADALALARNRSVPVRVRVLSEVYYAYYADSFNNGTKTDANLTLLRSAVQECRDNQLSAQETALALSYLGADLDERGLKSEARTVFEQLLTLYGADPLTLCERSEAYGEIAWIDDGQGQVAASLPLFRKAYEGYVACSGPQSAGALDLLPYWADALIKSGRAAEAVNMLEQALPAWRRVNGSNPESAGMLYFLAHGYIAVGRYVDAERIANELLSLVAGKTTVDQRSVGMAHLASAEALAGQQRYADAKPHALLAQQILAKDSYSDYARAVLAEVTALNVKLDGALH
jgi:eukaryotic-like serine/threonine-protein kinase